MLKNLKDNTITKNNEFKSYLFLPKSKKNKRFGEGGLLKMEDQKKEQLIF